MVIQGFLEEFLRNIKQQIVDWLTGGLSLRQLETKYISNTYCWIVDCKWFIVHFYVLSFLYC